MGCQGYSPNYLLKDEYSKCREQSFNQKLLSLQKLRFVSLVAGRMIVVKGFGTKLFI